MMGQRGGLSKTWVQREMTGNRKRTNLDQIKSVHFIISWEELRAYAVHGVVWYSYILMPQFRFHDYKLKDFSS